MKDTAAGETTDDTIGGEGRIDSRGWLALALLLAVQFMVTLDNSIVVVALPSMQEDLGFAATGLQWVVSGYALTFGGFLILAGRASDLYGRRRLFMVGLALFALASLACGLAPSPELLIGARIAQGVGAAIVVPAVLSLITTNFAEGAPRNQALALWGAASAGGAAAGLLIGGVLTQTLSWPWLFFINVPIGALGLVLAPALLSESKDFAAARLDLAGAAALTGGLGLLILGLTRTETVGLVSPATLVTLAIALFLLAAFRFIEGRVASPLVPFRVFRSRTLTGANLIVILLFACQGALAFFVTLYMQQSLGYYPLAVGFAFLPVPLIVLLISATGGPWAVGRFGTRPMIASGMLLLVVAMGLFSRISPGGNYAADLLAGFLFFSTALGLTFFTSVIAATAGVQAEEQGLASGLINTSQQLGIALGLGLLVPLAAARADSLTALGDGEMTSAALIGGYQTAFLVAAALAVVGALVALFFVREKGRAGVAGTGQSSVEKHS